MRAKVDYLYIKFHSPGPPSSEIQLEIKEILSFIGPKYNHDFSNTKIEVSIDNIPDIDDYDAVTIGLMIILKKIFGEDHGYKIQRHGLYADNNPRFDKVQLAWAFKEDSLSDIVGVKKYDSVTIGPQIWMAENLNNDAFRNGDPIREVHEKNAWLDASIAKEPAWCYYRFNSENGKIFGKLYNWYAVNDPRGLAPEGWLVPTDQGLERAGNRNGRTNASD